MVAGLERDGGGAARAWATALPPAVLRRRRGDVQTRRSTEVTMVVLTAKEGSLCGQRRTASVNVRLLDWVLHRDGDEIHRESFCQRRKFREIGREV